MNLIELEHALRQLRLGGIAAVLETRLHQAQAEPMAPIDLLSCLVTDELNRRSERLLERRRKAARRAMTQASTGSPHPGRWRSSQRPRTSIASARRGARS